MAIKKVGVLGLGLMGSGIVQTCAGFGLETHAMEVNQGLVDKGISKIDGFLSKAVSKGKMNEEEKKKVLGKIHGTTNMDDLSSCDIIIEAIIENVGEKKKAFKRLDEITQKSTIFATNTSSICVTELLQALSDERRGMMIGMHFFNPVPVMKLVEVVSTIQTEKAVVEEALSFARSIGKSPIVTRDLTGFVVNRLLVPYILDAIRCLEEGVGSIEDIDAGMTLGCGYPMGPFTLLDFVGLDTTLYIADIMFDEFKEKKFAPPSLLKRMVLAGFLGRKSGKGFYDYSAEAPKPNNFLTRLQ